MKKTIVLIISIMVRILLVLAGAYTLLLLYLTATEYRPDDTESLNVESRYDGINPGIEQGVSNTLVIWNIGYGGLGDNADFFMDYGKMVYTADLPRVQTNMNGIMDILSDIDADIIMLQEVDTDSSRSYHIDETAMISELYSDYDRTFAFNYKVDFVPYPVPPIGKIGSGIMTLSRYKIASAERIQLPCPFKWPVRIANLKRCLSINRIPVEGSDKELVMINLHLEAYDDGEGKAAQAQMLMDILNEESAKGNYVIAGGDFNQCFSNIENDLPVFPDQWQPAYMDIGPFEKDWKFLMSEETPSCRSLYTPLAGNDPDSLQYYIIDGFIVSSNIRVDSYEIKDLGFANSDHNPQVLNITLE